MKAIVQDRYGPPDVLELTEIETEHQGRRGAGPGSRDVRSSRRVARTARDPYVLRIMGSGLRMPKNPVPGTDVAGLVESMGRNVTRFQPGDEVFGQSVGANLWGNGGTYAEYAAVPESRLQAKPANLTFEEAASLLTSGPIAVQGIRDEGRLQAGQKVLINGAGGGVGTVAVQLAKANGADVTAVDSTAKLEMLRSIGADRVIDYTKEDFTGSSERYDLVLDIAGNHPWSELKRALTPEGTYVLIGHDQYGGSGHRWFGSLGRFFKLMVISPFVSHLHPFRGTKDPGDRLVVLKELIEAGKITPVIDRTFPLSEVPEAIRYLESGQVRGKIVITV